jgi:two-component system sensor histidine kinase ChvG
MGRPIVLSLAWLRGGSAADNSVSPLRWGLYLPRLRLGLRWTLLVALLPLLTLPWIGLRFVERMAELARDERIENQAAAARALAAALHERRDLLGDELTGGDAGIGGRTPTAGARPPRSMRVQPLPVGMLPEGQTDGKSDQWAGIARWPLVVSRYNGAPATTLRVRLAVARAGPPPGRLHLLVDVDDERWLAPQQSATGGRQTQPGDALRVEAGDAPDTMVQVPARIVERPGGWQTEVELDGSPRLLRVQVVDIDYAGSRRLEAEADSGLLAPADGRPPPEEDAARRALWADTIRALERTSGRVSIYDAVGVLRAQRGDATVRTIPAAGWQAWIARSILRAAVRIQPDSVRDATPGTDPSLLTPLARALAGTPAQQSQRQAASGAMPSWLLTSAHPIWIDDRVVGALVLEENTAARLALGQAALERLTLLAAVAVMVSVLALLAVASITVARVVRLRNEAESAIDPQGRVVGAIRTSSLRDEVGDLRDSHARVLARLGEHQNYLATLRGRLVHELRTPIMVVRSSLENLALESDPARRDAYVVRVQGGAARLERILASMGEASNLESMLAESTPEPIELASLLSACVDGYRDAFPASRFDLVLPGTLAPCAGVPEAIAQALDKLASNAVDFAAEGTAITVALDGPSSHGGSGRRRWWQVSMHNQGPPLPAVMADSLFDQMVSLRAERGGERAHLGLGLYLVRLIAEFHGGQAFARDRVGGVEVGFTLRANDA